ncbi:DNA sulfur modification protein DndD [Geodermatophilus normandii]|uniref:Nuclease SbcCD subunit C n=1 Tax=Geodermatophilus normandii TaxID=1137989 RepID=A0A317QKI0_9ACTN|nr:AAA family ATPase [Geodermatophilus normandii]PWW23483.1 DNA sulfur modification protein DndD [Geodermatophilus normandii]
MRLIELRMRNFRQFEGQHVLALAPDGSRNVTVVYGANGAGKTTLLNAFTWCLYGELSRDFMYPDRLLSDSLWNGMPVGQTESAVVGLDFEHEGDHFTLTRTARVAKISSDAVQKPVVQAHLVRRSIDGAIDVNNPNDFVDTVLPKRLHHFFFLNGERFEHLLSADAFVDIETAIKTILGIEIIERGVAHLKDVEKRLSAAYRKLGNAQEAQILNRLEDAQGRLERVQEQQRTNEMKARHAGEEISRLDERLRELEGSRRLQQDRDRLTAQYTADEERRKSALARRLDLIGQRGFLPFVAEAGEHVCAKYQEMREKREIPRPVKTQFIDDILEHGECVCGTDVSADGPARRKLESWRSKAGKPELEEAWTALGAKVAEWPLFHLPELRKQLDDMDAEVARRTASMSSVRQELSELSRKLGEADEEDIRGLEARRAHAGRDRDELLKQAGELKRDLKAAESDLQKAQVDLRMAEAANKEAAIAQRRVLATEDVRRALETMRGLRTRDVREELDSRIKSVFSQVVKKRQVPQLSESFELLLQEEVNGQWVPKAMSTGEAQVLTLSFVGGLADQARATYATRKAAQANPLVSASGGIFPFVADAIFGTLDESFRREVTRLLPNLAPQVVLFLSKAQSAGEVRAQLEERVGAVGLITSVMSRSDVQGESITLDGREYPYVSVDRGAVADTSSLTMVKAPESVHV